METLYCYSTDEENYTGDEDTRELAAQRAAECLCYELDDGETGSVWTGEHSPLDVLHLLGSSAAWSLLENMDEAAYDRTGDGADSFSDHVSKEAEAALQTKLEAMILQWAREYGIKPKLWTVDLIQEHTVRKIDDNTFEVDGAAVSKAVENG